MLAATSPEDYNVCTMLRKEMQFKLIESDMSWNSIWSVVSESYDKYQQLTDNRKELFRGLCKGTSNVLDASKAGLFDGILNGESQEYLKDAAIGTAKRILYMLMAVELLDRNNERKVNRGEFIEFIKTMNATTSCPREIIKFFHR